MESHEEAVKALEAFLETLPHNYPKLITCVGKHFCASKGAFYTGTFKTPEEAYASVQAKRLEKGLPVTTTRKRPRNNKVVKRTCLFDKSYKTLINDEYDATYFFWDDIVSKYDITLRNVPVQLVKKKSYSALHGKKLTIIFD